MTKHFTLAHGQEEPSSSRRQSTVVSIQKDKTKSPQGKKTNTLTVAKAKTERLNSLEIEDTQSRITERAYELFDRRGGHHGQDLDDWLTAEREILSEESGS